MYRWVAHRSVPSHIRLGWPRRNFRRRAIDKVIKFLVGLDVHKDSTSIAVCESGREDARSTGTIRYDVPTLLKIPRKYGEAAQVSVLYEAGPTGYGLYRELSGHGSHVRLPLPR